MSLHLQKIFSAPTQATLLIAEFLDEKPLDNEPLQRTVYDCFAKRTIENHVTSAVFLDVDGVVYHQQQAVASLATDKLTQKAEELFPNVKTLRSYHCDVASTYFYKPTAVSGLTALIEKVGCVIVLSANMRSSRSVPRLRDILAVLPFCYAVIDRTPSYDDVEMEMAPPLENRGSEISYWLQEHPSIKKYVIFDDRDDRLSAFGRNFVKVDADRLLTAADLEKAKAILQPTV
jgi:Swiss Army Knife RNA repair-like protein